PIFPSDPLIIEPAIITHPAGIDGVILPGLIAIHLLFAGTDHDVATGGTTGANAFGFFEKPNAHLETEILRCECSYRANVHRVQGIIIVEPSSRIRREGAVTAAADDSQCIIPHDVLRKTNTTRAENAPFIIQHN